jgi:hypothetical protein
LGIFLGCKLQVELIHLGICGPQFHTQVADILVHSVPELTWCAGKIVAFLREQEEKILKTLTLRFKGT